MYIWAKLKFTLDAISSFTACQTNQFHCVWIFKGFITSHFWWVSNCSSSRNPWLSLNGTMIIAIKITLGKVIQLFIKSQYLPLYQRKYDIINNTEITKKCKSISKGLMSHSSLNCAPAFTQIRHVCMIHSHSHLFTGLVVLLAFLLPHHTVEDKTNQEYGHT